MKGKMFKTLLLLLAAGSAMAQQKQEEFAVGDASQKLKPFERKYIQYTETKNGLIVFNAILTRKLERVVKDGKDQWLVVQRYQSAKTIDNDSSYCELASFKPLGYFTDIPSEGHKEKVWFTAKEVKNTTIFKDSVAVNNMPNKGLYNGVPADEIVACMPFAEKAVFRFTAVNPGLRYEEYVTTVTVLGQETVEVPGLGSILCWKVNTSQGVGGGSLEWYSVKDHVQVKKKFDFGNGGAFYRVLIAG